MKKTLLSLAIAISAILSMASCGGDDASTASKADESSKPAESQSTAVSEDSSKSEDASSSEGSSEEPVSVDPDFKLDITCNDELEDTELIVTSSNNGEDADSYWFFTYADSAAKITVYVDDASVLSADGIEFFLGEKKATAKFEDGKFVSVTVTADGKVVAKGYENGGYNKDISVEASVQGWECESVKGYVISVSVPYELMGNDSDSAYENLSIAPALINCNGSDTTKEFYEYCDEKAANGFMVVVNDDTFEESPFKGVVTLGACNSDIPVTGDWDTSKDYAPDDAKYADRIVTLSSDGVNTIYFSGVTGPVAYAEATFKLKAIKNNDAWPKFGFLFNDGADNGLFCFIDSATGDGAKNQLSDIFKDDAGYVQVIDGEYKWAETENTAWPTGWTYDKEITLAVLRNGNTVTFYVNGAATYVVKDVPSITSDNECSIGLNAFNLDLEVTNYRCTDDANDATIKNLLKK